MLRYHILDKQKNMVLNELTREEYNTCEKFYKKYKFFEDLYHSFLCGNDAVREYRHLIKRIENQEVKTDIHTAHKLGIFHVTSMILMLRLFTDNAKSYRKRIGLIESAQTIYQSEQIDEIKLLTALRNYAQHYAIPITNTKLTYDLLEESSKVDFIIKKDELLQNKEVSSNVEIIKKFAEEEVHFNELVDIWEERNKDLFMSLLSDFTNNIEFKMKKIFKKHMGTYVSEGEKYSTNAFISLEGKHQLTKKISVMDPMLIELIGISLNDKD